MKYQQGMSPIKTFFSRGFNKIYREEMPTGIIISQLNTSQHSSIRVWSLLLQRLIYLFLLGMGAFIGATISLSVNNSGPFIGGIISMCVFWFLGSFDVQCIELIQEKFSRVYKESETVHIWRKGKLMNIYGGGDTYIVAKAPFSNVYLTFITYYLTGKLL